MFEAAVVVIIRFRCLVRDNTAVTLYLAGLF